jgi:hypothetical protein
MAGIAAHGWRGQKGERLCNTKAQSASTDAFRDARNPVLARATEQKLLNSTEYATNFRQSGDLQQ